jgi:predicted AAA+ superfamily ATPase
MFLRRRGFLRLRTVGMAEIGADYNGHRPNCNAALAPHRDRLRPENDRSCGPGGASLSLCRNLGQPMAKQSKKSPPRAAQRPARADNSGDGATAPERIAAALERLAPSATSAPDFAAADAFVWYPDRRRLAPVAHVNRVEMTLLKGIDRMRDVLVENTERFAKGLPANNALLWGARGMGKSSLVKAVHAAVNAAQSRGKSASGPLKLVEIHREDIESLPDLMALMRGARFRFIVFCDDLSFEAEDTSYKSLKAMLEGGIEGRPDNVVFYATSNRRHLMARDMMENERSTAINPGEAVEEKVSLSDRFGLWLGFHRCSQDEYLAMVEGYVAHYRIAVKRDMLRHEALEWATTRGARSGRVAWQYVQDLAGRLGVRLTAR